MVDELKKVDVLFPKATDPWDVTSPAWWKGHRDIHARAYHEAAQVLAESIAGANPPREYLVFPLLFLHRHALELWLKRIIELASSLLDEPTKAPTHHDLARLWTQAHQLCIKIWPGADEEIDALGALIRSFQQSDQTATAFRYSRDKDGSDAKLQVPDFDLERHVDVRPKDGGASRRSDSRPSGVPGEQVGGSCRDAARIRRLRLSRVPPSAPRSSFSPARS